MKLIKLSALLVLALAMTVAATGCKKHPGQVTPLPGQRTGLPGSEGPVVDNTTGFKPNGSDVSSTTGNNGEFPTSATWDPKDMNQDRTIFEADTVYFAFDSSSIRSGEESKVSAVASALQSTPSLYLLIEGHCDERGTEEYNRSLGERRALSLREDLVKAGISPERIRTISYGEDRPAVQGHNEAAWSKNRRGVFVACTPK